MRKMKNKTLILIAITVMAITSCKKKEDQNPNPKAKTSLQCVEYYSNGIKKISCIQVAAIVTGNTFALTARDTTIYDVAELLSVYIDSIENMPKIYPVFTQYDISNGNFSNQNYISIDDGQGSLMPRKAYSSFASWTASNDSTFIEITNIDFTNNVVSGKFWGILYEDSLNSVNITNGTFTDIKLIH